MARRYELYGLVARTISHSFPALTLEILSLPLVKFFLLYRHTDDGIFDNFPKISDHFPKTSENPPKLAEGYTIVVMPNISRKFPKITKFKVKESIIVNPLEHTL